MATQNKQLLTLTEVSEKTGISMPTLQRYKKAHQSRIPSVGKGRRQRYPEDALPVFEEIKAENMARRGRPPKSAEAKQKRKVRVAKAKAASKPTSKAAKAPSDGASDGLLSLAEIGRATGISYPTLLRYVRLHLDSIPHEGRGRKRRYKPEAVEVFERLRASSKRGRKPKSETAKAAEKKGGKAKASSGVDARLRAIEKAQSDLGKQIRNLVAKLDRPIKVTLSRR